MKLERLADAAQVASRCADLVAAALEGATEPVLLLPAGRTPIPLYVELVARQRGGRIDLGRAHLFQLDELVGVARDDERGFQHFLRAHVLDPLGLNGARVHLLDGCAVDPAAEIARHCERLLALGPPHLAVLGIGRNGHVAFNEPGAPLDTPGGVIELAEATRAGLRGSFAEDELPSLGITLGLRELRAARTVALLATGVSKADVLGRLTTTTPDPSLPASAFLEHASFHILTDVAP